MPCRAFFVPPRYASSAISDTNNPRLNALSGILRSSIRDPGNATAPRAGWSQCPDGHSSFLHGLSGTWMIHSLSQCPDGHSSFLHDAAANRSINSWPVSMPCRAFFVPPRGFSKIWLMMCWGLNALSGILRFSTGPHHGHQLLHRECLNALTGILRSSTWNWRTRTGSPGASPCPVGHSSFLHKAVDYAKRYGAG